VQDLLAGEVRCHRESIEQAAQLVGSIEGGRTPQSAACVAPANVSTDIQYYKFNGLRVLLVMRVKLLVSSLLSAVGIGIWSVSWVSYRLPLFVAVLLEVAAIAGFASASKSVGRTARVVLLIASALALLVIGDCVRRAVLVALSGA